MKENLIGSASTKEELQSLINGWYFSENYIITDDYKVFNTKLNKYMDDVQVLYKRKRWRFERVVQ